MLQFYIYLLSTDTCSSPFTLKHWLIYANYNYIHELMDLQNFSLIRLNFSVINIQLNPINSYSLQLLVVDNNGNFNVIIVFEM